MHCDLIKNEWLAGYQELVEALNINDPRCEWKHGDYQFATAPHEDEDCPFKDVTRLYLKPIKL